MSDDAKTIGESHLSTTLSHALFKAIENQGTSIKDVIDMRLSNLSGMCNALAIAIFESNVKSSHSEVSVSVAYSLSLIESELHIVKALVEHGLSNKEVGE